MKSSIQKVKKIVKIIIIIFLIFYFLKTLWVNISSYKNIEEIPEMNIIENEEVISK